MHGCLTHIGGWQKHSFIDFPGTVSAVLFYSGCNLRCPFCHNPALVLGTVTDPPDPAEITAYLQKRRGLIEGVVLSGGEPTIHASVCDLVHELRALGYRIKLDTNGLLPDMIEKIAPDYLALDIKTRPEMYPEKMGAAFIDTPQRLLRSIEMVKAMKSNAEIRITLAPHCVDNPAIENIGMLIKGVNTVYLQEMHQGTPLLDPHMNQAEPFSPAQLQEFKNILLGSVKTCLIRGTDT